MPNGSSKNISRLLMTCASYRARFGEWPTQARFVPIILHDLANVLDTQSFERLAAHLELRTQTQGSISVGGKGVVKYEEREPDPQLVELAHKWLPLEPRRSR
jgi:hypothetical protein